MKSFNDILMEVSQKILDVIDKIVEGSLPNRKRIPLKDSSTVSIAASGTGSATISVASGYKYFIKSWTVTAGADVTVDSIKIDDNDTYQIASLSDTIAEYGELPVAETNIVISGSNAGSAAEDLTIEIKGYKVAI